jgi:hypothetical protein
VPATGSSDMPTTPLKPAKSTGNADTVAKKVDEDDFKEHAVGDGGGNRHGSRGKVWLKAYRWSNTHVTKQSPCCNESLKEFSL